MVDYYQCPSCGFLQTEDPYWLSEAYANPINLSDTGILRRNALFARVTSYFLLVCLDRHGRVLDAAGGYGILTRHMRDFGFDARWHDRYTKNLLSRGFEHRDGDRDYELITSFESFEHFADPLSEIEAMMALGDTLLFSTMLLPRRVPAPDEWWYYGFEHGQHISFYTIESLRQMASQMRLSFVTNGRNIHAFSRKRLSPVALNTAALAGYTGLAFPIRLVMSSRTEEDSRFLARLKG